MDTSSRWLRGMLIGVICILFLLLMLLCAAAAILTYRQELFFPTQPGVSQRPATAPSTSTQDPGTTSTIPGTTGTLTVPTTLPTVPTTGATAPTTQPTVPKPTVTVPPAPTTRPTAPTTQPTAPTTQPTAPTTQPTAPTTQPTAPTTQPTEPTQPQVPFDEEKFFAESAFIGDSVTVGLRNYCASNSKALYGATFLCAGSYAVRHAIDKVGGENVISITYQGEKMRPEDALAATGAKRVFIMLGLNDIALLGIDKTLKNWGTLIGNIRSKCPDIDIYIQSGTPIWIGGEKGSLNNTNMDKYNVRLEQFCQENGCTFVNVASVMKDAEGGLRTEYCSDKYCHLNYTGIKAWIAYLKAHAPTNFQ